jgi:hypothetical protein
VNQIIEESGAQLLPEAFTMHSPQGAASATLVSIDATSEVSQRPWYATVATLVTSIVTALVALAVIPHESGERVTAIILSVVAFGFLAVKEAAVVMSFIKTTRESEQQALKMRSEAMKYNLDAVHLQTLQIQAQTEKIRVDTQHQQMLAMFSRDPVNVPPTYAEMRSGARRTTGPIVPE